MAVPPSQLTDSELDEMVYNLRSALEKSEHMQTQYQEALTRQAEAHKAEMLTQQRTLAQNAKLKQEVDLLKRQLEESKRHATMAGILSDRQAAALKRLASENSELLALLSGLPSLRSAIANHVVNSEDLSHLHTPSLKTS